MRPRLVDRRSSSRWARSCPAATGSSRGRRTSSSRRTAPTIGRRWISPRSSTNFRSCRPISRRSRRRTWPRSSQEQIDQIYARLSAGPIPGRAFRRRHPVSRAARSGKFRAAEIMGGLAGQALHLKGIELEAVGEHAVARQGVLPRRARAAQPHRRPRRAEEARSRRRRSEEDHRSTARMRGSCSPPSSTAARACSIRGASRSSSTTSSPTRFPAIRRSPISWPAGAECACATRSGWCARASISAAPISIACSG